MTEQWEMYLRFHWLYECDTSWRDDLDEESRALLEEWDGGNDFAREQAEGAK